MSNCIKLIIISLAVFCSSILCGQNANVSYGSCVQPGAFLFDDAVEVCIGYFDGGGSFVLMDCNSQQLGGINGFFHKSTTLSNFFLSNAVWLKVTYSNGCDVYLRDSSWIVFAPPLPPAPSPDYNFCLGPNTDYNSLEIVSDCDVFIEPGGFQGGNKLIVRPKLENDSDGDGTPDEEDAFPNDPSEWLDTDGDTIGNNTDSDDDNDTYSDVNDAFPLDASEWLDTDGDTIGNNADTDDDNDSYLDDRDAFPLDASEWIDTDGDLVGDNSDAFPNDPTETTDTDGDGVGDNSDLVEENWLFDQCNLQLLMYGDQYYDTAASYAQSLFLPTIGNLYRFECNAGVNGEYGTQAVYLNISDTGLNYQFAILGVENFGTPMSFAIKSIGEEYSEREYSDQIGQVITLSSVGDIYFAFSIGMYDDSWDSDGSSYYNKDWGWAKISVSPSITLVFPPQPPSLSLISSKQVYGGDSYKGNRVSGIIVGEETSIETTPNLPIPFSVPVLPDIEDFYESTSGITIEIDATPTDGYPTNFSYQWYFDGFPVPSMFGGTDSAYTIDGSESSNGTWRVEVTNDAGTTSAEFEYRAFTDADGDGLSDYRESNILGTNPNLTDTDSDGLNDYDEVITHLTDPNVADSDSDGLSDGSEVNTYSSDPLDTDSDNDGLLDGAEVSTHSTDPIDADTDNDGLLDEAEVSTHLTNPNSSDSDSDQLSDHAEINTHLTDPNDSDTDNDGLNDAIEINTYSSNPLSADTSGDGFDDGFIVGEGLNPTYDYSALRSSTISNVVSNSEAYGLYALDDIKDLRPGSTVIEVSGNQATVQLQMEESSDLQTWEDTGTPATMTIPADTDTKFFRFKMAE